MKNCHKCFNNKIFFDDFWSVRNWSVGQKPVVSRKTGYWLGGRWSFDKSNWWLIVNGSWG